MGASIAPVAAAAIIAKERRIVDRFREVGAISPESACAVPEIGVHEGVALMRLRRHEVIREAAPQRFYLDEAVWLAVRRTRRRFVLAIFSVILVVLVLAVGATIGIISTK